LPGISLIQEARLILVEGNVLVAAFVLRKPDEALTVGILASVEPSIRYVDKFLELIKRGDSTRDYFERIEGDAPVHTDASNST
jgi:predicted aconitase with swiveling domain